MMKIDLTGKRVFVSGSTGGIGLAAAEGLLAAGATVVINGRSETNVAAALERLEAVGPGASGFVGDLGSDVDLDRLAAAHPAIDILVSNLGAFASGDFFETDDEDWAGLFQINVLSGIRLARLYGKAMAERCWGRIVFVSSESAINIPVDSIPYAVTKSALLAVSRGLAKRLAETGVTVNAVIPGPTLSDGMARALKHEVERSGDSIDEVAANFVVSQRPSSLIRRAASVGEVANMIVYVCSEQASATTGAALRVDGGVVETIF